MGGGQIQMDQQFFSASDIRGGGALEYQEGVSGSSMDSQKAP